MKKTCTKCEIKKSLSEFNKSKRSKGGHRSECKACGKIYREENKEEVAARGKKWYENNREISLERAKDYRKNNKENIEIWKTANKEKLKKCSRLYSKEYRKVNEEKLREKSKRYYEKNKEIILKKTKRYYETNKEKISIKMAAYFINRRKTDLNYKITCNLRTRINHALRAKEKNRKKYYSTIALLGMEIQDFILYLESLFLPGMTRNNYGEWHIDHIVPCASFDLTDPEQQKICFCHTNLQPLWAIDNIKKGCKLECA